MKKNPDPWPILIKKKYINTKNKRTSTVRWLIYPGKCDNTVCKWRSFRRTFLFHNLKKISIKLSPQNFKPVLPSCCRVIGSNVYAALHNREIQISSSTSSTGNHGLSLARFHFEPFSDIYHSIVFFLTWIVATVERGLFYLIFDQCMKRNGSWWIQASFLWCSSIGIC